MQRLENEATQMRDGAESVAKAQGEVVNPVKKSSID